MQDSPRPFKRSRVLVACQRCKARRQKCDNATPACSNCGRAKVACTYLDNAYPTAYVKMLEERVAYLETQLNTPDLDPGVSPRAESTGAATAVTTARRESSDGVLANSTAVSTTARGSTSQLASGLGLLSSCAAAEPHYFGLSSGLSLAHFVQAAIDSGNTATEFSLPSLADRPFLRKVPTSQTPLDPLPSSAVEARFIRAYLSVIHPLYPFLDRKNLWDIHQKATQRDQLAVLDEDQLDLAILHLVYAIGSRCLQLLNSSKIGKDVPERHFVSAMKKIPEAIKFTSIRSIKVTLLLAIHSMRSPSGTSVWQLCGLAMRQCLELGMHKQRIVSNDQTRTDQLRKRLFWSVYILERKTALVLGRPFAISDKEIDAEIPLDVNDNEEDPGVLSAARESQADETNWTQRQSILCLHRHHILLYHIHTRIRFTLHRLKKPDEGGGLGKKVAKRFQELEAWKETMLRNYSSNIHASQDLQSRNATDNESSSDSDHEKTMPFKRSIEIEKAELMLEYHKARRSLLQSLMTEARDHYNFRPEDYAACADSAGQICQIYRRLYRLSTLPFSLRDLHAIFVAGFTLIYCICAMSSLYDAQRAGHIGACSTVLYVITEQWPSAKKYRDGFEAVAEKMVACTSKAADADARHHPPQHVGQNKMPPASTRHSRYPGITKSSSRHFTSARMQQKNQRSDLANLNDSDVQIINLGSGAGGQVTRRAESLGDMQESSPAMPLHVEEDYPSFSDSPYDIDTSIGLEFDPGFDGIEGLLTSEGMDWFAGVIW